MSRVANEQNRNKDTMKLNVIIDVIYFIELRFTIDNHLFLSLFVMVCVTFEKIHKKTTWCWKVFQKLDKFFSMTILFT
jgi:hypothetical protein